MSTDPFRSAKRERARNDAVDRHFDRIYKRLDDVHARVAKLERAVWVGSGALTATGAVAVFNLINSMSGGG